MGAHEHCTCEMPNGSFMAKHNGETLNSKYLAFIGKKKGNRSEVVPVVDVGGGFAFVWTSEKSLSFPPILISKIFVCFIMNATTAVPQTLVLDVESSAVSEQLIRVLRQRPAAVSFTVLELHLRRLILRWVTVYCHCDYEQATRSHHTNRNCLRCPRQQTRQFWFWQKDISYLKLWWSKFDTCGS